MSIVRDIGIALPSLEARSFVTCSTGNQAPFGTGTTGNVAQSSDGAVGISGRIIDRLSELTRAYPVCEPFTLLESTKGSTAADRKVTLGVKLQHGDSSGGGDMADYSTGSQPSDKSYFSSARSTDHRSWDATFSTGGLRVSSAPSYYDIRAAKRYVRAVHIAYKNSVSTESTGDEGARLSGGIVFKGAESLPDNAVESWASTTTST